MTKILFCGCACKYQDERYGKNNRVHNSGNNDTWICTVCENKRSGK